MLIPLRRRSRAFPCCSFAALMLLMCRSCCSCAAHVPLTRRSCAAHVLRRWRAADMPLACYSQAVEVVLLGRRKDKSGLLRSERLHKGNDNEFPHNTSSYSYLVKAELCLSMACAHKCDCLSVRTPPATAAPKLLRCLRYAFTAGRRWPCTCAR